MEILLDVYVFLHSDGGFSIVAIINFATRCPQIIPLVTAKPDFPAFQFTVKTLRKKILQHNILANHWILLDFCLTAKHIFYMSLKKMQHGNWDNPACAKTWE